MNLEIDFIVIPLQKLLALHLRAVAYCNAMICRDAGSDAVSSKTILSPAELKTLKGIRFSRQHLHRLIRAKKFPRPLKLGAATNGWLESEIDEWIEARTRERHDDAAEDKASPLATRG